MGGAGGDQARVGDHRQAVVHEHPVRRTVERAQHRHRMGDPVAHEERFSHCADTPIQRV